MQADLVWVLQVFSISLCSAQSKSLAVRTRLGMFFPSAETCSFLALVTFTVVSLFIVLWVVPSKFIIGFFFFSCGKSEVLKGFKYSKQTKTEKKQSNPDFEVQIACFISNEQFYLKEVQHLTIRFTTTYIRRTTANWSAGQYLML